MNFLYLGAWSSWGRLGVSSIDAQQEKHGSPIDIRPTGGSVDARKGVVWIQDSERCSAAQAWASVQCTFLTRWKKWASGCYQYEQHPSSLYQAAQATVVRRNNDPSSACPLQSHRPFSNRGP